jgi:hypothetical protein
MGGITVPVTDSTGTFAAPEDQLPVAITLLQNYPNPFNPATTIVFSIDRPSFVRLEVFGITGRRVAELLRGRVDAGEHRLLFSGEGLPSGTYLLRLSTATSAPVTRKLVLLR